MLICVKGDKVLWSRFVSNGYVRMSETANSINLGWSKGSAYYDATTGEMLKMGTIQIKKK